MTQRVQGKTAVVIGGASGIGWTTVQLLAREGARVVIADVNGDAAAARAGELGEPATSHWVDVGDEDSIAALSTASTAEGVGTIDILVNCAGVNIPGRITDLPLEQWRTVIDVCLTGAFLAIKHTAPVMTSTPLTGLAGIQAEFTDNTPLGRNGQPADIAEAVLYLASDASAWVTGETLDINGGAHLRRYPDVMKHLAAAMSAQAQSHSG